MQSLKENIREVLDRIQNRALKSGRNLSDIKLIAVSKTVSTERILEAANYGIFDFGENKVQELVSKLEIITDKRINFHLIGHLQTNKVKYIVGKVKSIQSLDSIKLTEEIDKRSKLLNVVSECLIEVNTSGEETKFGLKENELDPFIEKITQFKNLKIKGLMTIGALTDDEKLIRDCFIKLRKLKEKYSSIKTENFSLDELSMGMTNDFEIAIEEGATILRIGTAIFGERSVLK